MNADTDFAASVSGGYSIKETGGNSTKESFSVTILQIIVATSDVNPPGPFQVGHSPRKAGVYEAV